MFRYLVIAVVVMLAISIIYWVFWHNSDRGRRQRAKSHIGRSSGTYDQHARRAAEELGQLAAPRAQDYFQRGRLLQRVIAAGHDADGVYIPRDETQLATRQPMDTVRGPMDTIGMNTVRVTEVVLHNYALALQELVAYPLQELLDMHDPAPEFIIYQMGNMGDIPRDTHREVVLLQEFADQLAAETPQIRAELATERRNRAVEAAPSRHQAIESAFDAATQYTDDRQNVHDPKVNDDLRAILGKLRASAQEPLDPAVCILEAREYITNGRNSKSPDARRALDQISLGLTISTFNEAEDRIFALVWSRCSAAENSARANLMRDAVVTSLADCTENGGLVCINGRCARLLNSLVTLDYDKDISETGCLTYEAYRNQVFQEVKVIIDEAISSAKASSDEQLRLVGAAYETGEESGNEQLEGEFKRQLKKKIDDCVGNYSHKLTAEELRGIREECYIYGTI
jgi:hypothetical protein